MRAPVVTLRLMNRHRRYEAEGCTPMEISTAGRSSTFRGVVEERLPDALFRVRLTEASRRIVAHVDATPRRNFMRLLPGDRVTVELAVRNRARGRITRREGTE